MIAKVEEIDTFQLDKIDILIEAVGALSIMAQLKAWSVFLEMLNFQHVQFRHPL